MVKPSGKNPSERKKPPWKHLHPLAFQVHITSPTGIKAVLHLVPPSWPCSKEPKVPPGRGVTDCAGHVLRELPLVVFGLGKPKLPHTYVHMANTSAVIWVITVIYLFVCARGEGKGGLVNCSGSFAQAPLCL